MTYKIKDNKTGLYSEGGFKVEFTLPEGNPRRERLDPYTHPDHPIFRNRWSSVGKTWNNMIHVKNHLKLYGHDIKDFGRFEIEEVKNVD